MISQMTTFFNCMQGTAIVLSETELERKRIVKHPYMTYEKKGSKTVTSHPGGAGRHLHSYRSTRPLATTELLCFWTLLDSDPS